MRSVVPEHALEGTRDRIEALEGQILSLESRIQDESHLAEWAQGILHSPEVRHARVALGRFTSALGVYRDFAADPDMDHKAAASRMGVADRIFDSVEADLQKLEADVAHAHEMIETYEKIQSLEAEEAAAAAAKQYARAGEIQDEIQDLKREKGEPTEAGYEKAQAKVAEAAKQKHELLKEPLLRGVLAFYQNVIKSNDDCVMELKAEALSMMRSIEEDFHLALPAAAPYTMDGNHLALCARTGLQISNDRTLARNEAMISKALNEFTLASRAWMQQELVALIGSDAVQKLLKRPMLEAASGGNLTEEAVQEKLDAFAEEAAQFFMGFQELVKDQLAAPLLEERTEHKEKLEAAERLQKLRREFINTFAGRVKVHAEKALALTDFDLEEDDTDMPSFGGGFESDTGLLTHISTLLSQAHDAPEALNVSAADVLQLVSSLEKIVDVHANGYIKVQEEIDKQRALAPLLNRFTDEAIMDYVQAMVATDQMNVAVDDVRTQGQKASYYQQVAGEDGLRSSYEARLETARKDALVYRFKRAKLDELIHLARLFFSAEAMESEVLANDVEALLADARPKVLDFMRPRRSPEDVEKERLAEIVRDAVDERIAAASFEPGFEEVDDENTAQPGEPTHEVSVEEDPDATDPFGIPKAPAAEEVPESAHLIAEKVAAAVMRDFKAERMRMELQGSRRSWAWPAVTALSLGVAFVALVSNRGVEGPTPAGPGIVESVLAPEADATHPFAGIAMPEDADALRGKTGDGKVSFRCADGQHVSGSLVGHYPAGIQDKAVVWVAQVPSGDSTRVEILNKSDFTATGTVCELPTSLDDYCGVVEYSGPAMHTLFFDSCDAE